jgi:RNA-binding protein
LQRIGLILHTSPNRNIIVKLENIPRIGETVVDEKLKPIGKVFDILGPVSSPYAAIKPLIRNAESYMNKMLYAVPPQRGERSKNRHG